MTPDGTPIVGPTGVKGLWLNTGPRHAGLDLLTMSCGLRITAGGFDVGHYAGDCGDDWRSAATKTKRQHGTG